MPEKYFSERFGFSSVKSMKAKRRVNQEFELALFFEIKDVFLRNDYLYDLYDASGIQARGFWLKFIGKINRFFLVHDELASWINEDSRVMYDVAEEYFSSLNWHQKLSFIEIISDSLRSSKQTQAANAFMGAVNSVCKRFDFDWRWLNLEIGFIKVTDDREKDEVRTALDLLDAEGEKGALDHLEKAIQQLSSFLEPNYRSSANESVSALESYMRAITGKNGIGASIKNLSSSYNLPRGIRVMLEKLYAYANDQDGAIRHGQNKDFTETSEAEARLFLIQCSSWINYLKTLQPSSPREEADDVLF